MQKIKSGLKSVGSTITAPLKGITGGIGKAIPLLLIGILVNSIGGIIKGVREYYDENIKPKVEFVNKKVKQFNDFISGFDGETERVEKEKTEVNEKIEKLKSDTEDDTIQENIDKIKNTQKSDRFKGLSKEEIQDKIEKETKLIQSGKTLTDDSKKDSELISSINFSKSLNDMSFLNDSNFFDESMSKEIVYVFQDRIIEVEV